MDVVLRGRHSGIQIFKYSLPTLTAEKNDPPLHVTPSYVTRMSATTPEQAKDTLSPCGGVYIPEPGGSATHTPATLHHPSTRMYVAGIMDHFSDAPKMELIVWSSTVGIFTSSVFLTRSQLKNARSKAGDIKPGSTGPRIWTNLAKLGQFGLSLPPLVYWVTTAHNKFHQPEWMTEYALPSPPDVFGVDGVTVGRAAGLLVLLAGTILTRTAMRVLGDQLQVIGVSLLPFRGIPNGGLTFALDYRSGRNPDSLMMGLLHTSATRFTRKFPTHYLLNRVPYDPYPQREPSCWSLSRSCSLVVYSSLRLSHCHRWGPTQGSDRGT